MKKLLITLAVALIYSTSATPQGCIMVRNITGFGQYNLVDNTFSTSEWQLNISSRYFKAWRDFKGSVDQKTPEADRSIIRSFTLDMTVSKSFRNGWSLGLSIPYLANSRSATKEHGGAGTPRHETHATGLGDIRIVGYKWLLKPHVSQKFNAQLGFGFKFPSGNYHYEDYFFKNDTTKILAPVNASIQLGDGGTGIVSELNLFYILNKTINVYGYVFYLANPRDVNGVSTTTWRTPTALQIASTGNVYSVPDVYSLRGGVNFDLKSLVVSAGVRRDGVPYEDLLGDNHGLRRPGYNFSFEPGMILKMKRNSMYVYVPVIAARKVSQDPSDARASEIMHEYRASAGGSGNFYVFAGMLFRL